MSTRHFAPKGSSVFAIASVLLVCAHLKGFPVPSFMGLGDLPGGDFQSRALGLSADGTAVTGNSSVAPNYSVAYRWTAGEGMINISGGLSSAGYALSADGGTAAGIRTANPVEAFQWAPGDGPMSLGDLPGGGTASVAYGMSGDGAVIVGQGSSASGTEAFRWTSGTGMVGLGDLAGGVFFSKANAISTDGATIVGRSTSAAGTNDAFRWTQSTGMLSIGDFGGGNYDSEALAVSADGLVIVGYGTTAGNVRQAYRWASASGMVPLGDLPGGGSSSTAIDVSADGSIIVGQGDSGIGSVPFVWDAISGMRSLAQYLQQSGLSGQLANWSLTEVRGVSDDGQTFAGTGLHNGLTEAWIATVPEPSSFVLLCAGGALFGSRRIRR